MRVVYLFVGNVGRRLTEWSNRRLSEPQHVVTEMLNSWLGREAAPWR